MTIFRDISETRELVDSFTRPAQSLFPVARLREDAAGENARWANMVEMGWLAIGLPEGSGGVGLTLLEEALAAQTFGRHLLSSNYPATVLAADASLRSGWQDLAASLLDGSRRAALARRSADEGTIVVVDAEPGDVLVVITSSGVDMFDAADIAAHDSVHWASEVSLAKRAKPLLSVASPDLAAKAQLIVAGMLAGIASECRDRAVEYAKVREQFGQPIGAFQAVKHHCANMAITAHAARELVSFAALSLVEQAPESEHLAMAALNLALRAARDNAGLNIQIHGGMGFSDECDAHLFLKAARILNAAVGGIDSTRQSLMASVQ
jgi:alkylation response protein AidB-like acyl-CoA dehydrogenase